MVSHELENNRPNSRAGKTTGPGEKPSRHDGFSPGPVVLSALALLFGPSFSSPAFSIAPVMQPQCRGVKCYYYSSASGPNSLPV